MTTKPQITTTITPQGKTLAIVPLSGKLESRAASALRPVLQQLIEFGCPNILLDLAEVPFMDSSGLGVLISGWRRCRNAGGYLCLCSVTEGVEMVLRFTSMEQDFPIFLDRASAIAEFPH